METAASLGCDRPWWFVSQDDAEFRIYGLLRLCMLIVDNDTVVWRIEGEEGERGRGRREEALSS